MVTSAQLNKIQKSAILILVGCCIVLCYPSNDEELMQADDYDYDADDQSSTQQSKAAATTFPQSTKANRSATVTGFLGENIVLRCDEKITTSNVILWYQDDKIISNGNNVVLPNFSLDPHTFNLTILKSSPQSAGNYYCEVLPQKILLHTKVFVVEHSLNAMVPESSTSAQNSLCHYPYTMTWMLTVALALQHCNI